MNLVTWTDDHGGHHVGEIQKGPNGDDVQEWDSERCCYCVQVFEFPGKPAQWPRMDELKPYPTRSERGEE